MMNDFEKLAAIQTMSEADKDAYVECLLLYGSAGIVVEPDGTAKFVHPKDMTAIEGKT